MPKASKWFAFAGFIFGLLTIVQFINLIDVYDALGEIEKLGDISKEIKDVYDSALLQAWGSLIGHLVLMVSLFVCVYMSAQIYDIDFNNSKHSYLWSEVREIKSKINGKRAKEENRKANKENKIAAPMRFHKPTPEELKIGVIVEHDVHGKGIISNIDNETIYVVFDYLASNKNYINKEKDFSIEQCLEYGTIKVQDKSE